MVRYGVVRSGWFCCQRPSPCPRCLFEDFHERILCSRPAGTLVSEWARVVAALFSGGCLFTPASPRHTSLAAQPTDNLWCSNRQWCVAAHQPWASAVQDKGLSRIPDTHTFPLNLSICLPSQPAMVHTASTVTEYGRRTLSSAAKRHREVSWHQWSSNSPRKLALHHRDVRNLPTRDKV